MKMLRCSNCGADLEIKYNMQIAYCMYCGAKIMLSDWNEDIKAMEMADKVDLLLKGRKNQRISFEDIDMAHDIAKTLIKLYPSNYLGYLKLAQVYMAKKEPLVWDCGSKVNYRYLVGYSHIADNLKQARILASENQMNEIEMTSLEFGNRVINEKRKYDEKHIFIKKQLMVVIKEYPQMLNGMRIVPDNDVPKLHTGDRIFYMENKNILCEEFGYNCFMGRLAFWSGRLYFCSTSLRKKGFFEFMNRGDGFICEAYEVHIGENGYIIDNNDNNLVVKGKTFRIEFSNYSYGVNYGGEPVGLEWKCFWGAEEKLEVTSVDYAFFKEMFEK